MSYRGSFIRPSAPKPYDFVPVAEVKRFPTYGSERIVYDDNYFSGQLTFEIKALSPVFVSNGRYGLSEDLGLNPGQVMRGCYRINGQPVIPASSLKGIIRSVAEAVSCSCITATRVERTYLPRNVTNTDRCCVGPSNKGVLQKACPACALFGGGGTNAHIGLVRFADVLLNQGELVEARYLVPLYAPRVSFKRVPTTYLDAQRRYFRGRKFYFHGQTAEVSEGEGDLCEVIPTGATLTGNLSFINLDRPLLGVLFFALGMDGTFNPKLGGGKPACFGSLEIIVNELRFDKGASFVQAERSNEVLTNELLNTFVKDTITVAEQEGRLLKPQMTKLREIWQFPNSRACPSGMY